MTDLEDVTAELRAVRRMLAVVVERLDAADKRANRNRLWTFLLALSVMGASLTGAWFVQDSRHERDRICEAVRGSAEALIAVTEKPADGEPRTPEEQKRRDALVEQYRALIAKGCPG